MRDKGYSVWIEAEGWAEGQWDIFDGNTDVIVTFEDGPKWSASFFTYRNIQTLAEKNKRAGECLYGKYFWGGDMLLVDECSRNRIEEVVAHLLAEGEFTRVFREIEDFYESE